MNIQFRDYRESDAAIVPKLFIDSLRTVYPGIKGGSWGDLDDVPNSYLKGGCFIVGLVDGTTIAMGGLKRVDNSTCEMKRVVVAPGHQGQGLGQSLVNALEARAKKLGFKKVILDTTAGQRAARLLYEKNGYHQIDSKTVDHPTGNRFDTYYYEKVLS